MDTLKLAEEITEYDYALAQSDQRALDEACDILRKAMEDNGCTTWAVTSTMREIGLYPTLGYKWRRISFYADGEGAVVALPYWFTREVD